MLSADLKTNWGHGITGLACSTSSTDPLAASKRHHKIKVWDQISKLLPRLAHAAQMAVMVSASEGSSELSLRRRMEWIMREVHIDTQNYLGIDVSINTIVLPPSIDENLLARRIINFLERREWTTTGAVVEYRDIVDQSIGKAIGGTSA